MKNKFLTIAGIAICAIALGLNLQNAFDGYGVKKGTLHPEVLAQTNTNGGTTSGGASGTSSGADSSFFTRYKKDFGDCTMKSSVSLDGYVILFGKRTYVGAQVNGEYSVTYYRVSIDCKTNGESVSCTDCICARFWADKCGSGS